MKRAQCLIARGSKILMVRQKEADFKIWLLPGGKMKNDESAEEALRELEEECRVEGKIRRMISFNDYNDRYQEYTFSVDIGDQMPALGTDPELAGDSQSIVEVGWKHISELDERERVLLWAAGLMSVDAVLEEMEEDDKS